MRPSPSERPARSTPVAPAALAALAAALLAGAACSAPVPDVQPRPPPPPAPAPAPPAPPPASAGLRRGRTLLAEPEEAPLPFTLAPIAGGRSVLAVAQRAGDRAAWVRRLDQAATPGPLLRFVDQHVFGAFDRPDGSTTYVTTDGAHVCFGPSSRPEERGCTPGNPAALVPVGDRLALLELTTMRLPEPAHARPSHPAPAPALHEAKEGAHRHVRPAKGSLRDKGARGDKGDKGSKGAKKKPTHAAPSHRATHPLVELFVRWVQPGGAIDARSTPDAGPQPTGLHFEAPLDGMALADARARDGGIDVLWFETAPGRPSRAPLGSGRLMAASLRPDGTLDFGSRVAVADADLEYGQLKDHHAPRLAGNDTVSVFLDLDARGQCEALRVRPSLARLAAPPAACLVAPDRLADPPDVSITAALERLLTDDPRRAFGQPLSDPGRAAWAGDRAFYLHGAALRSASLSGGPPRDEPPPFPARRASIAWGSLTPDGEGLAFAGGHLVHVAGVSAGGAVQRAPLPGPASPASAPDLPPDRRRASRIGATWWTARGPRLRLWPDPAATPVAPAHPDTAVLVGGSDRGLSLEIAAGALHLAAVDPAGTATRLASLAPSPVRPGFDACERAAGGALVAGFSAADPAHVVTFTVDASGHAGDPHVVPLPAHPGELGVRLVPLPGGGALLTDLARRHVLWLDDDARPQGEAPWPPGASDAVCPDGRPLPLTVPAPTPLQFVPVPDAAEGACLTGDPVWSRDGSLHWFGGTAEALDFYPGIASLPLLPAPAPIPVPVPAPVPVPVPVPVPAPAPIPVPVPAPVPVPVPAPAPSPAAGPCPADMVSIAGRYCVDRFEATLTDLRTGALLSPDYPTTPNLLDFVLGEWSTARERTGSVQARAFPLPWISPARLGDKPEPVAVSRLGVRPNGYLTGVVAEAACAAAGKRLCTLDEFVTACRGEGDTLFPYGDDYQDGVCNVFREEHPAALLHGNASVGHLDPRLNRVISQGKPLLRSTGESPGCRSRWGDDAVYDMVGNLDEWVDEGNGAFAGGFYARSTRSGCEALVTAHPKGYLDYSTGARCCRDAAAAAKGGGAGP